MGNENDNPNNYYMCLNLIGESMDKFLYCISQNPYESYAKERKEKKTLYDYWDYLYNPTLEFYGQLAITMNRLKIKKDSLSLNYKECLIVKVSNIESIEIQHVLDKVNSLNREHYIPLLLFLCDSFEIEDLDKFNFDEKKYSKIDKRMVFFEKYEADIMNEEKMRRIRYRLERFCSYHNELGDRFTIGTDDYKNDYDLTEMNFPFTVNICCIGRFGKGKSTGVNTILGEKNAKENKSGTSATLKINYYQVCNAPVKVYDMPGFENQQTVLNALKQFKYLNEEIRQLQDQIHIFLYFIKSTDERMFSEMEYKIFKQILKHKDSFVIYVLTHSSEKTDRNEIYDMINTGIRGVIDNKKKKKDVIYQKDLEKYQNMYLKMVATADNCIFVNFHKTNKLPIYGISDFFNKIALFAERTEAYKRFQRDSCLSEEEFQNKIKEEARIRKIRAKALISRHKIGSAIAGLFPGADYLANKYFIKKDAARKAGQIFGFDLQQLEESIKRQELKKENLAKNNSNSCNLDEDGYERPNLTIIETKDKENIDKKEEEEEIEKEEEEEKEEKEEKEENNNEKEDKNNEKKDKKKKKKKKDSKVKIGKATMYTCSVVSCSTSIPRVLFAVSSVGLMAVSAVFTVVGSALGMGIGYYLMKKHCEELIDQFELLFIQNADRISDSLIFGINYLKNMEEYYKKLGF